MLADGIDQFCKDLNVPPDDFKILVLAWKLNAEQMCRFTRGEFVNGLKEIKCDSIKAIQTKLPELVQEVAQDEELFKDLYRLVFFYSLIYFKFNQILLFNMWCTYIKKLNNNFSALLFSLKVNNKQPQFYFLPKLLLFIL